jgi:hypothetical protein
MLEKLITLVRSFLANRTIDGIAGELEKKVARLKAAEIAIIAHVNFKNDLVEEAKAALEALLNRTSAETKILAERVEKSKKTRAKLTV